MASYKFKFLHFYNTVKWCINYTIYTLLHSLSLNITTHLENLKYMYIKTRVQAAIPTATVPTTAVPTAAIPTTSFIMVG